MIILISRTLVTDGRLEVDIHIALDDIDRVRRFCFNNLHLKLAAKIFNIDHVAFGEAGEAAQVLFEHGFRVRNLQKIDLLRLEFRGGGDGQSDRCQCDLVALV